MDQQQPQQCLFCQIASGTVPSKVVYEDQHSFAFLDINPANPGHIILMPKEHYAVMPQIPDDIVGHIGQVSKALSRAVLRATQAEGTNVFVANGMAAGQRAQHFMLHIIPRKHGDGIPFSIPQKTMKSEDVEQVRTLLVPVIKDLLGFVYSPEDSEEISEEEQKKPLKKEKTKNDAEHILSAIDTTTSIVPPMMEEETIEEKEGESGDEEPEDNGSLDSLTDYLVR